MFHKLPFIVLICNIAFFARGYAPFAQSFSGAPCGEFLGLVTTAVAPIQRVHCTV